MMSRAAHAPDGLLAPKGFLGTSHRFLFKIGGRNTTNRFEGGLYSRFKGGMYNRFMRTPPVNVPGSLELTRPGRGTFDIYEDGESFPLKIVMAVSQKGALTSAILFADH